MWHLLIHLIRPLLNAARAEYSQTKEADFGNVVEPGKFIGYISKMGYYKYADSSKLPELQRVLSFSLVQNNGFSTLYDRAGGFPLDYRLYNLNGEMLLEKGGVITALKPLKRTFDKLEIPMLWTNESVTFVNDQMEHWIALNGKDYLLYKGDRNAVKRAGLMKMKVVEMLNDQLRISRSDEQLYLISSVKEGQVIFLTKKMYKYIFEVVKNKHVRPLELNMWGMWNQLI